MNQKPSMATWDEIRADLATERTFWTAIKLHDGLKFVSGCGTEADKGIDVIRTDHKKNKGTINT